MNLARRVLLVVGAGAGLQVVALLACAGALAAFDRHAGVLAAATVEQPRPPVSALVPDAVGMLGAAAIVVLASAASWVLTGLVARRWGPRRTRRGPLWRLLLIPFISAQLVLAAAMALTPAVTGAGAYAAVVVALPNAAVLAATVLAAALGAAVALVLPAAPDPAAASEPAAARALRGPLRAGAWALAAAAAVLVALLVVPVIADRPIADDYRFFANIRGSDLVSFLRLQLNEETGRYTQGALMWLAFVCFGTGAIQAMPVLLLLGLAGGLLAAIRVAAPVPLRSWAVAAPLAIVGALGGVLAMPSVPDSLLWLSASTVYLPGAIGWVLVVACLLLAGRAERPGRRGAWTAIAVATAFLAQGSYEAVSALGVLVAVLAVVAARSSRQRVPAILVLLAALAGLAIVGFAPAVQLRAGATAAGSVAVGAFGSVFTDLQLWHGLGAGPWLLAAGAGIVVALGLSAAPRRATLVAAWTGSAVVTVVPLVCGAISFLGLGWAPIRTYAVPGLAFGIGLALVVGGAAAPLARRIRLSPRRPLRVAPQLVVALALAGGLATTAPTLLQLAHAETLRATAVDARDVAVAAQLAAGADPIVVTPAPLLFFPAEARDFEFRAVQPTGWFSTGFRRWFRIPEASPLRYVTRQPAGYCVDDPRVSSPVVRTCAELAVR